MIGIHQKSKNDWNVIILIPSWLDLSFELYCRRDPLPVDGLIILKMTVRMASFLCTHLDLLMQIA